MIGEFGAAVSSQQAIFLTESGFSYVLSADEEQVVVFRKLLGSIIRQASIFLAPVCWMLSFAAAQKQEIFPTVSLCGVRRMRTVLVHANGY
jgi:hypothetical protein